MERNQSIPYRNLESGDAPDPAAVQGQAPIGNPAVGAGQPGELGWWKETRRNKPQLNSSSTAALIFGSAGLNLAYSVGFAPSYKNLSAAETTHLQICWFIAVIIGAFLSVFLVEKLTQRVSQLAACVLVIASGILFVVATEPVPLLILARYLDGIAFGFTLVSYIVVSSEQAFKKIRGVSLSSEHFGLISGVILKTIHAFDDSRNDRDMLHGIISIIYGCFAVFSVFFYTKERPMFYLRKGDEETALDILRQLQKPKTVTPETYQLLNENKDLHLEDTSRGFAANIREGLLPLFKICIYRSIVAMSFSLPLVWGFVIASGMSTHELNFWSVYLLILLRMIGIFIGAYTMDILGRKAIGLFTVFLGGVLLLVSASLMSNTLDVLIEDKMSKVSSLLQAYQLLAGVAAPITTCYTGEAFSISVKPLFVLCAVMVENVVQIIICCCFGLSAESFSTFGFALGAMQLVFAVVLFLVMPETKNTTLREALDLFRKPINANIRL